jgi:hypothetical protein
MKSVVTSDDWETFMLTNYGKIGELLTCVYCLGHWVGLFVATIISLWFIGSVNLGFILFGMFTYPLIAGEYLKR